MRLIVLTVLAVLAFASPAFASGVSFTSVDNTIRPTRRSHAPSTP